MSDGASNCLACGAPLQPGSRFCNACGAPAPAGPVAPPSPAQACPTCGAPLTGDTRFCGSCGAPIGAVASGPVAAPPPPPPPPSYQPVMATAGGPAYPVAQPAKKSHGCLIAIIVVAVLALLGLCCGGVIWLLNSQSGSFLEGLDQLGSLLLGLA